MEYNADILLNLKYNERSLERVATTVGRIETLAKQLKPINLFSPGAGAGADQVKVAMEAIAKRAAAIAKNGSQQLSATFAGAAQQASVFAEVLRNVKIEAEPLAQQNQRVQDLAKAFAEAAEKAEILELRYSNLIQSARSAQGLAIGPATPLGGAEEQAARLQADIAGAQIKAETTLAAQRAKNNRNDITYQRLKLNLLLNQTDELLKQNSITARLAKKAAEAGGAGKLGESLALGAGFPLLFGGGPGSVVGSVIGSFFGSGFGGQILGGALGQSLDQAVQAAAKLGNSFALVGDNYSSLREQGIAFTAEIERQVVAAKELGNFTQAQELVRGAVFQQTGDIGGLGAQGAASAVNELGKAWNGVTKAVQTLLGSLGSPFIFVLTAVLRAVQGIVVVFNLIITAVGKLISLIPGIAPLLDKAYESSLRGTAEYENQLAAVNKQIDALGKSLKLEELRTDFKRRMIGASKEEQQELEKRLKVEELSHELNVKIAEIRAASPGQTDEQLAKVEELVKAETAVYNEKVKQLNIDLQIKQAKEYELELEKQQASQIKANAMLAEGVVTAATTRLQNQVSIASAANSAYLALNDLEMQRARNAGDTEKQYKLQLQRARLIYQQTVLQIKQEERKAKLAVISSQIKLKELEATVAQKAAKGEALAQDYAAVELQKQAVQLAYEGVSAAQQIAQYNLMGANAVRTMAIEQAKFNKNKAAGEAIGGGAGVRVYGPSGTRAIGAGDPNAYLSSRLAQLGVTSGTYQQQAAATLVNNLVAQKREQLRAEYRQSTNQRTSIGESRYLAERGYADGGFVTRPTNAMVGEGGQPEYVIPASKMNDAMRRYSAGTRGEAVVTGAGASGGMSSTTNYSNQQNAYYGSGGGTSVNITTGPVMRLGNRNYVTVSDMQRGMAAAVGAAEANMMSRMSRSYAARRSMGL